MSQTKTRRFMAVLLAMVMMMVACSLSLFAFAVGEEEDPTLPESVENLNIHSYVHFGDSMSTGYMLGATQDEINAFNVQTTEDGGFAFPTGNPHTTTHDRFNPYQYGSYPSLIAEAFGLSEDQWYSFAREGLTTNDIHRIMDPSYYSQMDDQGKRNSDKAFETLFGTPQNGAEELAFLNAKAAEMLPKVDLVTFGMGPNDIIISPLFDVLFKLQDATAGNTLYSQIAHTAINTATSLVQNYDIVAAYQTLFDAADVIGSLPEILAAVGLSLARGYMAVQQNWEAAVNLVRSVNDHAIIVCIGGYNATRDLQFADIDLYRVGRNMGIFTTIMNLYWANSCSLRDQYYFVDIRNVDLPTWPTMVAWPGLLTGGGFMGYFMYCSHPSEKGHAQIADAVLDTLFQEDGTNTLPVTSLL
ncbi:MAG: hypothetical protein IJ720_04590 [Clostridia bacterium]|nr:hypothetical protein [Clostridia bacterium]